MLVLTTPSTVTHSRYDVAMAKKRKGGNPRGAAAKSRAFASELDALDAALARLWESIAAGDLFDAEVQASELLGLPDLPEDNDESHSMIASGLIGRASRALTPPDQAAFLRLLIALGAKAVKRQASEELADLTSDGIYPPEWVTGIGKAVPGQAYRASDDFGDQEVIAVTFTYGDAEHAIAVALDLAEQPTVIMAGLSKDTGKFLEGIQDDSVFRGGMTPIALTEARRRLEGPLAKYGADPDYDLDPASLFALPLVRSRVRRLPAPAAGTSVTYTAADRGAAVAEFLDSSLAAEAGAPDVARFWAQVLTGYSSRLPDEPPATVGKHRLAAALLLHVPTTFELSGERRDGMRQAVTVWTRWAAARQGTGGDIADALVAYLDGKLDDFPDLYDAPESAALRGYVRDLVTPDADLAWLADLRARRELAAPPPDDRDPDDEDVDAADPAGRATLAEHEFASCAPAGAAGEKFLDTAKGVVEELWHGAPLATWQSAKALLAKGLDRHDVIHRLVESSGK